MYVKDSVGQIVRVPITIEEIQGPLVFNPSAATGPIRVTSSTLKANQAVPTNLLVNLTGGAGGGTPPYKYEVAPTEMD